MRKPSVLVLGSVATVACASGGPAALGFGLPAQRQVAYEYVDSTLVDVSMMGQSMGIAMLGRADYDLTFSEAPAGLQVSLTVRDLDASVEVPMAGVERATESDVRGPLVFTLDPRGRATVTTAPQVSVNASRVISRLSTAHTLFPRLPARAVSVGDRWVDTVSYEGEAEAGEMSETAIIEYMVRGDSTVAGRDLLHIGMSGTSEIELSSSMGGMSVRQRARMEIGGHVLWDGGDGLVYELYRTGTGTGTASVPISPAPLPIRVDVTQRLRLLGS